MAERDEIVKPKKISFKEACEFLEKENAKLEELCKMHEEETKKMSAELKQLQNQIKCAVEQSKLVENINLKKEKEEVSKQSALLDIIHRMICKELKKNLDDASFDRDSRSKLNCDRKTLSRIFHVLIPDLESGSIPTKEVVLVTDDSMKNEIDLLLSANIIERLPNDPRRVKLCRNHYFDLH